jgi:hypothetical protein
VITPLQMMQQLRGHGGHFLRLLLLLLMLMLKLVPTTARGRTALCPSAAW